MIKQSRCSASPPYHLTLTPTCNTHTVHTQISRMHRQVDDLQAALLKALHDRNQPTVIVQGSGRNTG